MHAKLDKLDTLYGDVHRSGGIEERLKEVIAHRNDLDSSVTKVKEENRKLRAEVRANKK